MKLPLTTALIFTVLFNSLAFGQVRKAKDGTSAKERYYAELLKEKLAAKEAVNRKDNLRRLRNKYAIATVSAGTLSLIGGALTTDVAEEIEKLGGVTKASKATLRYANGVTAFTFFGLLSTVGLALKTVYVDAEYARNTQSKAILNGNSRSNNKDRYVASSQASRKERKSRQQ